MTPAPSATPTTRPIPEMLRSRLWRFLIAAGLAAATALPLWLLRNLASDASFYSRTQKTGTEAAYQAYVGYGWLHVAEAKQTLVKLAFENAKRAKNVAKLREFLSRYPSSPYEGEARQAIHARYQEALDKFRQQASQSDPRVAGFMTALVAYLEAKTLPGLLLRVEAPPSDALQKADRLLAISGASVGNVTPIAPHFTSAGSAARANRIVAELGKGFSAVFPPDVLTLRQADATAKKGADPQILIQYEIRPSDMFYSSQTITSVLGQKEVFVGIYVQFRVRMELPGQADPLEFGLQVAPPQHFTVHYQSRVGDIMARPSAGEVYVTMADRAFDELSGKLRKVFFAEGSDAFKKAGGAAPVGATR